MYLSLFVAAGLILFLGSDRSVNLYDEGIALTAAMRIMAGQVVHRDFYYNYGPANVYVMAGLFKLFGQSVLVARMWGLFQAAFTAVGIYIIARRLSSPATAITVFVGCLLWQGTLSFMTLCVLWSTWLLIPAFQRRLGTRRAFAAGLMVGISATFRYDLGMGLACAHAAVMMTAAMAREGDARRGLRAWGSMIWPYLLGYAALVAPLFLAYWAAGAIHDFLYDIVLYPAKYYHAARNLPFPRVGRHNLEDLVVYVFPVMIGLAFYGAARWWVKHRKSPDGQRAPVPDWVGHLVAFGTVGVLTYTKGLVRISAGPLFLCTAVCLLIAAVLFTQRESFDLPARAMIAVSIVLFAVGGVASTLQGREQEHRERSSMLEWIVSPARQAPLPPFRSWCQQRNVLSKGFCYFPDNDHIEAIEYLTAHTRPTDTLYVGLSHHDRILIDDNLTYFAAQRLPATKWSHFDPFLQNREDTQREMIGELERNRPPYVVLDSEFERESEPNGSRVSTGVHLLDDYIAAHYRPVQTFGELTILERWRERWR